MGYLNLVDSFIYGEPVFRAKLDALAENDAYLKDNGWQTSTKTLFFQAAAPTGWTKDTTNNDKFLRVVDSIGAGTGGTKAPSAVISLAHTAHSITLAPAHTHDIANHTHYLDTGASNGSSAGGTTQYMGDNGSGYMYRWLGNGGGTAFTVMRNKLSALGFLTSGSDGSHNHGGNSTGAALSDITFAYCDVIVCGKDTSSGYTALTTYFNSGDKIDFDPFVTLANNDAFLKLRLMPSGSILAFGQSAAPTGWTKLTTLDDKALRVVSGTGGGNGGSASPSTQVTMTHTHTTASDTGHTHTIAAHSHSFGTILSGFSTSLSTPADSWIQADAGGVLRNSGVSGPTASRTAYQSSTDTDGSGNTGTNSAHTHTLATSGNNFTLAYLDIIQASKNAAGEPYAYEDVTSGVFGWKKLVSKQKLNKLAKNDEFALYHTTPSATKAFFYMASAPLMWTRLTTQNDKALRMVSGSSGGSSGGTHGLSVALPLAHTHSVSSVAHTHAIGTHTHTLASGTQTANAIGSNGFNGGDNFIMTMQSNAGSTATVKKTSVAAVGNSDSVSHDHGGVSGSALTDVTLAYVDVLYCTKD